MNDVHLQNRNVWEERARIGMPHTERARDEDFRRPLEILDPCGWFEGPLEGKGVLCLAAGGGKHSVLCAAAGAKVTVLDISPEMLARDRQMAAQRGLPVRTVEASMDHMPMFHDGEFDVVIQPVSTCYAPDVRAVYREVARVTAPGGLYISQHKQPASLQAEGIFSGRGYLITEPCASGRRLATAATDSGYRERGAVEFLHPWQDLIGGLCQSGFVIEDLIEPRHGKAAAAPGTFEHRSAFLPPFVTIKARRKAESNPKASLIYLP